MNKKSNNVIINSASYGRCFDQWRTACLAHWQALCGRFRTATELEVDFWQMGLSG